MMNAEEQAKDKGHIIFLVFLFLPWIIIFLIYLCNCDLRYKVNCNFYIDNMCINTNGYPIHVEDINWLLSEVQYEANTNYSDGIVRPELNIKELIEDNNLQVEFLDPALLASEWDAQGAYWPGYDIIQVSFHAGESQENQCIKALSVFGHELLHFLNEHYFYIRTPENDCHALPGIFIQATIGNNSLEERISWKVDEYCN